MLHSLMIIIIMHFFDCATFFVDYCMLIRRKKVLIAFRYILSAVAFVLGFMVQMDFFFNDIVGQFGSAHIKNRVD